MVKFSTTISRFLTSRLQRRRRKQNQQYRVDPCEQRVLLSAVNVVTSPGPQGSVSLIFQGTDSADEVFLGTHFETGLLTAYSFSGTTFRLNGGPEVSSLTFPSLHNVTFNLGDGNDLISVFLTSANDLRLNPGSGSDSAYITDVNMNDLKISDGFADGEQNTFNIQNFASSFVLDDLTAAFDRGSSQINVMAFAGQTIELGEISLTGKNVTNMGLLLSAGQNSHIWVNGKVRLRNDPASFGVANLTVNTQVSPGDTGSVDFENGITVNSPGATLNISGNVNVAGDLNFSTTGFFNDTVAIENGAPVFHGRVTINTGEGDDFILMEKQDPSLPPTRFRKAVSISTGGGNDIVNIGPATFANSLNIHLGSSNPFSGFQVDNVRLGNVDVAGNLNVTSTGDATVLISPSSSGQAMFHGNASFILGGGRVFITSSNSNVVFDRKQIFTGQPNRIQVFYIGDIIANLTKRVLTNADLFTF